MGSFLLFCLVSNKRICLVIVWKRPHRSIAAPLGPHKLGELQWLIRKIKSRSPSFVTPCIPFQQQGFSLRHWNSSGTWWQQSSELSLPKEKGLGSNSPAQGASQEIMSHSGGSMLSAAPGWPSRAVARTCRGEAEERTWFIYSWAHSIICQEPGPATHCRQKQFTADRQDD